MTHVQTDVIIVGGGLIGATLAHALALGGLSSAVIDTLHLPDALDPVYDGRASAIASASVQMLRALGLWQGIAHHAQPIREIRVTDGASPLFLHFDGRPQGDEPLGEMVENRHIRWAQFGSLMAQQHPIQLHAPCHITAFERGPHRVDVTLSTGARLRAPVVVACDGRHSPLRREARIHTTEWSYHQDAFIATLTHRDPHGAIAHERFFPDGPFAILPMVDDPQGRHRSAIVLTLRAGQGAAWIKREAAALEAHIRPFFGDFLGPIALASRCWSYPLGLIQVERLVDTRLALVGDSAHAIHPIAGQGLNLGFRDVAALAEVLTDAARLGLDLGAPSVLERYERWRRADITLMHAATDGLNRLFATRNPFITAARRLGLRAVHHLPPLKNILMSHARGTLGQVPKLLTGQGLI